MFQSVSIKIAALAALWLVLGVFSAHTALAGNSRPTTLYYAKLSIETTNGVVAGAKLNMLPAGSEFRMEGFDCIRVTGEASAAAGMDILSEAEHNAISRLLMAYGLKSVNSRQVMFNTVSRDVTFLSYEGVVKTPVKVLQEDYIENRSTYSIDMEVWFAPLAFPSKWSLLYVKAIIKNACAHAIAFFP